MRGTVDTSDRMTCGGARGAESAPSPCAPAATVDTDADATLDCLACGACCRSGHDGRILVPAEDLFRWKRMGRDDVLAALQPGHFGESAFATTPSGACVHLGTAAGPHACGIYAVRGTTCRAFERGSWQCHEFRRDAGIEAPR